MYFKILKHIRRKIILTNFLHLQHFAGVGKEGAIGEILMGRGRRWAIRIIKFNFMTRVVGGGLS
jgi:hypothetical protein